MKVPQKAKALKLIDDKSSQFQKILDKATYENRFDNAYQMAYYGTEALLSELFSEVEAKKFRLNVTGPVVIGGSPEKELRDYKEHIGTCLVQLQIYRERIDNFWDGDEAMMVDTSPSKQLKDIKEYDVFISHAGEDKDDFARPLANALIGHGLKVWFDEFTLTLGENLRRSIDRGLSESRFGVVILSPSFFEKEWPQTELDGLAARERNGIKVILPIWHKVDRNDVLKFSPTLADRVAAPTSKGLDYVINEILKAVRYGISGESTSAMPDQSAFHIDRSIEEEYKQVKLAITPGFKLQPGYTGKEHNYAFTLELENRTSKTITDIEVNVYMPKVIYNNNLTKIFAKDATDRDVRFVFKVDSLHPGKKEIIDSIFYRVNTSIDRDDQDINIRWEIYAKDMLPSKDSRPLSEMHKF